MIEQLVGAICFTQRIRERERESIFVNVGVYLSLVTYRKGQAGGNVALRSLGPYKARQRVQ